MNARARPNAPHPKCLPEIGRVTRPIPVRCHVEQARTADGRVDYKPLERVPAAAEIALEDVVYRYGWLAEIADEVMDAFSRAARDVILVTMGDRLQRVVIHEFVAGKDGPIGRLRRIVVSLVLGTGLGVRRRVGTGPAATISFMGCYDMNRIDQARGKAFLDKVRAAYSGW